jgi:hypothetical protein
MAKDDFFSFLILFTTLMHMKFEKFLFRVRNRVFSICVRFADIFYAVVDPFVLFKAGSNQ